MPLQAPPAPIPLPRVESPLAAAARTAGGSAGRWLRRAGVQSRRFAELLRAARTPDGRRQNLAPLLTLAASGAFVLGLALAWRRGRS